MKKSIFLSLVLSLSIVFAYPNGVQSERLPLPFVILPQPQNVILLNGSGLEPGILKTVIIKGQFSRPVMGNLLSHLTTGDPATKGTLTLILDKSLSSPASDEGYIMTIYNDRVEVISKGEAGLFYGCQSLEQLLEDALDYDKPVPSCKITDYPLFHTGQFILISSTTSII